MLLKKLKCNFSLKNVAFIFTGIGNIAGGGGAERFFSDFFNQYQSSERQFNLFFITDENSLMNLKAANQLKNTENIITYNIYSNRFKNKLEALQLAKIITIKKISILQIPLYNIHYYPLIKAIDSFPSIIRPKLIYTITDSFVPHYYNNDNGRGYNFKTTLEPLFQNIKLDAIISWYELFKEFAESNNLIKSNAPIYCIQSRYSGKKFNMNISKKNNIIYAGRLTIAKRPLMFVEALRILKEKNKLTNEWNYFIYGKGNLEAEVIQKIKEYDLSDFITVTHSADMTPVFEDSKCFISTQDFENFPSLAMNEAMAAGNAIISRNVGQTNLFVKHLVNGILAYPDTEEGLANAIEYYITNPQIHKSMQNESIRLTEEVHTFQNFKSQIENFWDKTIHLN